MTIGTQLSAPNGWGDWQKDQRYYFGGTYSDQVLIVNFYVHNRERRVRCSHIDKDEFENALTGPTKKIIKLKVQLKYPPWILAEEDTDFDSLECTRYKLKKHECIDTVKSRKAAIEPLLERQSQILGSDDPLATIAKIGREHSPKDHMYRLQLWFFSYILHSKNDWALHAANRDLGIWDRGDKKYGLKKFGRTYKEEGSEYGWSSRHFSEKVVDTYLNYCNKYKTMMSIYNRAMTEDFECEVRKNDDGRRIVFNRKNDPYPSYSQYRQIVIDKFGLSVVQQTVYGHVRVRNTATVNQGSYISQLKNVLESIEVDAYRCNDRPRAAFSNEALPPLIVARAICVKTGAVVGVGFSFGSESREAYRSMLLCMALPKSIVAKLYGIPEKMLDWPMSGLSPSMLSDRGPAGFESLLDSLVATIVIKSGTPSYQPRSKCVVEGSNPKSAQQQGEPSYTLSVHDLPAMMRREIMWAVRQNRVKDISSHMSEEETFEFHQTGLTATPQSYWIYLTDRLRTSGYSMEPNQAIKAFCKPVKLGVDEVAVRLFSRYYSSTAFRSEGHHANAVRLKLKGIKGYCIPLATRYIWMEFLGKLMELEAQKSASSNGEDYYIPLSALADLGESVSQLKSRTRKSGRAAAIEIEKEFKELTGKAWDAGTIRKGSPKKGRGTVAHETAVLNDKIRKTA